MQVQEVESGVALEHLGRAMEVGQDELLVLGGGERLGGGELRGEEDAVPLVGAGRVVVVGPGGDEQVVAVRRDLDDVPAEALGGLLASVTPRVAWRVDLLGEEYRWNKPIGTIGIYRP
ncbi:hypothetical protein [uncultured Parolsenella sp.]|uniref:hypothetical protein n=1 Tax=uncultured Parolsenella sp. TaxID=2083008 RepID=UPI0027D93F2C|nr:hypothetical protein [uncultured Parolsenella sp.]